MACFIGGVVGYFLCKAAFNKINKSLNFYLFIMFKSRIWFLPKISTIGVSKRPLLIRGNLIKRIDQGWVEYFGGQKIYFF